VQSYGETWKRLHTKFRVNRYEELPAARFEEARAYLLAKLPQQGHGYEFDFGPNEDVQQRSAKEAARQMFDEIMRTADWNRATWTLQFANDSRFGCPTLIKRVNPDPKAITVNRDHLAAVYVDLGRLRERIDGLGLMASDLPPSWWEARRIS
jgi:hypothetical protein